MKSSSRLMMILLALALILSGIAAAQDKPKTGAVDLKILPPAVLKAFQAAYPKAVIKGASKETENGVTVYEIESVDGMINRDLIYTADGKATDIEEATAPENLPAPVKQTLAKEYPGAKILKAEILTKDGAKFFELSLQVKGNPMSVTIDPQGRIEKTPAEKVKTEAKEAEENEKDEENEEKEAAAKPVDLKILPPAVLKAFQAAYPKAVIKGASKETENGVTVYEIESVDGMINRDLIYTADGKATDIEEATAPENLPAPVKQTLAKGYPGAKILKAEILTKGGIKLFELSIQVKDKMVEVAIDPQGKIIK